MAELLKGTGVVWGVNATLTGTGIFTGTVLSLTWDHNVKENEIPNADGETQALVLYDQKKEATIEVTPTGASVSAANTNNVVPEIGADITIVDANDAEIAGQYIYIGGGKQYRVDDVVKINMKLRKYRDQSFVTIS